MDHSNGIEWIFRRMSWLLFESLPFLRRCRKDSLGRWKRRISFIRKLFVLFRSLLICKVWLAMHSLRLRVPEKRLDLFVWFDCLFRCCSALIRWWWWWWGFVDKSWWWQWLCWWWWWWEWFLYALPPLPHIGTPQEINWRLTEALNIDGPNILMWTVSLSRIAAET